jgi:prolyl oligopeptidase
MLSSEIAYPEYADLVVEELMVPSHDGVRVPVSLMYKKGTPRDGSVPVFIRGYGAYGASQRPLFDPTGDLLWAQQGGIVAVAHVRGGGELGEAWHKAGMKATKPNTWKDLIATAEYLVKNRYTGPGRIAINSASAGGIMIGRAMTERPDLFAAAIPQVGSLNVIRKENTPNGPVNIPEYGTVQKEDEARAMLEMDSFHHLKPGTNYPATLITAGFNDPRVIAWEPAKFAARLQASTASGKPVLFLTDYEAGHGIGDSKQKSYEAQADVLAFGLWQTGHPAFQPAAAVK